MVSIIENRATISGTILSISEEADARGFTDVMIELSGAADFEEYPNLARADEGSAIKVRMQKSFISETSFQAGDRVKICVRKVAGQVYFLLE